MKKTLLSAMVGLSFCTIAIATAEVSWCGSDGSKPKLLTKVSAENYAEIEEIFSYHSDGCPDRLDIIC